MITKLSIRNFKSIKELDIDCARVNLFIGEPNAGKSNILEALGLLSWCGNRGRNLNEFVRFKNLRQLFHEGKINQSIQIDIDSVLVIDRDQEFSLKTSYNQSTLIAPIGKNYHVDSQLIEIDSSKSDPKRFGAELKPDGQASGYHGPEIDRVYNFIKFYRFKTIDSFPDAELSFLVPPYGSNLVSLIIVSEKIRETISQLSNDFGLKIIIREDEDTLEFVKQLTDIISFSYPYITVSDTLLRMIFYNIAIDSNENSTLVFEEPEVHAFPAYIKELGEKIAFDESNQYFIVTHNPYLFLSIVEKTSKVDVNVFATYMKDYQTKVKHASHEQVSMLMDYDPFFNLGQIIEEDDNDSN